MTGPVRGHPGVVTKGLSIVHQDRLVTAIDVGKSKILIGRVDLGDPLGHPVARIAIGTRPCEAIEALMARVNENRSTVHAVGVALFGPLDTDPRSRTYAEIKNASDPGWEGVNVPKLIFEATGQRVSFHYDTKAALLSAQQLDLGELPISLVSVGTGIGAAHQAIQGDGRMPQFGHMWVRRRDDDHFVGSCMFHRDCLQGLASGRALAARVHAEPSELASDHPALDLSQHYLAQALHAVECVLGPRSFRLTGGVVTRPHFVDGVTRHLRELQRNANGVGGQGMASSLDVAPAAYLSALHGAAIMANYEGAADRTDGDQVSMVYPPRI